MIIKIYRLGRGGIFLLTNEGKWVIIYSTKSGDENMSRITNEYLINDERYTVDIRVNVLLGRTTIRINDDKFVLKSFPFRVKRCEPFMIGDKRCVLTVTASGKAKIE